MRELVSDEMWAAVAPLLPEEPPKPKGGRPRCSDRDALRGIVFVLRSGIPWEMLPREVFRLFGHDVLAAPAGLAADGCLGRVAPRALGTPAPRGRTGLVARRHRLRIGVGKKGGRATGPNPTDRGRAGTKRHCVTDRRGTPLGVTISEANRHDSKRMAPTLDMVPPIRSGRPGRPRQRPTKLHADKGYDYCRCRTECRERSITPRIARRGIETSARLGRHRWVVERTFAWFAQFRRLATRYERRADIHMALTKLAAAMICMNQIYSSV